MSGLDFLTEELYKRFGTVQRARGCFLYTKKGVRLTDLFLENGRAVLGWGGGQASTLFKNILSRGITGSFTTELSQRTEKAVSELLASERRVYFFRTLEEAVKTGILISKTSTGIYKPWSENEIDWRVQDCVVVIPPFPWTQDIYILAVKASLEENNALKSGKVPAPLNAAAARSIYDLIKAKQERSEKDWFRFDKVISRYFDRKGPYLYPKVPEDMYSDFVLHCLDCGLVINPDPAGTSIVPFGADPGVFGKLKANPFEFQEKK